MFGGRGQTDSYRTVPRVIPEDPRGLHRDIAHDITRLGSGDGLQQQRRDRQIEVREGVIDGAECFERSRLHRKTLARVALCRGRRIELQRAPQAAPDPALRAPLEADFAPIYAEVARLPELEPDATRV